MDIQGQAEAGPCPRVPPGLDQGLIPHPKELTQHSRYREHPTRPSLSGTSSGSSFINRGRQAGERLWRGSWGPGPPFVLLKGDLCWSEVLAGRKDAGQGWLDPDGLTPGAALRVLSPGWGCSGRGHSAELAPERPTPRKGSGIPQPHPEPPRLPPPGQQRIPVCPRGCGDGSIQDWITPTSPKSPGTPPLLLPAGPGAGIGVCGKCLSPWEWDGLQRDPQPGWSQTPQIPPAPSLPALDGVTFVSPTPVPRGAAGTDTGLWGHPWGALGTPLGGSGDTVRGSGDTRWGQGDTRAVGIHRDVLWGGGDGHTPVTTGAPLPWVRPARRDQRPGLKESRKIPRSGTPGGCQGAQGCQEGQHRPPPTIPLAVTVSMY